jgi:hypothetical protein
LNEKLENIEYEGYYPGGMDRGVISNNGWNMGRSAPIWKQIDKGVTVSACGGPAYGGGPHITNATFWDNRILMKYLFRGRDLGECFLRSTLYVNWSTSLIGDPLYHPDLNKTIVDNVSPEVDRAQISVSVVPSMGNYAGQLSVPVLSTINNPEVCLLQVFYSKKGSGIEKESSWPIYSTSPSVYLRELEPDSIYTYRIVLIDPYGNKSILADQLGDLSFKTGPSTTQKIEYRNAVKKGKHWESNILKLPDLKEHGTVEIDFIAGEQGLYPSFRSGDMSLETVKWSHKKTIKTTLKIGCPDKIWFINSPIKQGEKASLIARWRRFPLTREVVLKAADGTEFVLLADVRTPWEDMRLKSIIEIMEKDHVEIISGTVLDDALPASPQACGIDIPPVDADEWEKANKIL